MGAPRSFSRSTAACVGRSAWGGSHVAATGGTLAVPLALAKQDPGNAVLESVSRSKQSKLNLTLVPALSPALCHCSYYKLSVRLACSACLEGLPAFGAFIFIILPEVCGFILHVLAESSKQVSKWTELPSVEPQPFSFPLQN